MQKSRRPRGISLCHQLINKDKESCKMNINVAERRITRIESASHGNKYHGSQDIFYQSQRKNMSSQNPKILFYYRDSSHQFQDRKLNEEDSNAKSRQYQNIKIRKQKDNKRQQSPQKTFDLLQINQMNNKNLRDIISISSPKLNQIIKDKIYLDQQYQTRTKKKDVLQVSQSDNPSFKRIGKIFKTKSETVQLMEKRLLQIIKICSKKV